MLSKLALVTCATAAMLAAQSRPLDIYWIDVEGGAATLIVSPTGQSLLVDAGNPGPDDRDPKRIFAVTQMAGLKKIDMLLTTHFHGDHVGGTPALSKMIPIGHYYDHGDSIETTANAVQLFKRVQSRRRRQAHHGQARRPHSAFGRPDRSYFRERGRLG